MKRTIFYFAARIFIICLLVFVVIAADSFARQNETPKTNPPTTTSPAPPPASPSPAAANVPKLSSVTDVYKLGHEDANDPARNSAAIGEMIIVKVENLKELFNEAQCLQGTGEKKPACEKQELALYLDNRKMSDTIRESINPEQGTIQFHLQRSAKSDEAWADLLGAASGEDFYRRLTKVSVGLENGNAIPIAITTKKFYLQRGSKEWFRGGVVGFLALLAAMIYLAGRSDILRDVGDNPPKPQRKPFSLARCQMALWFFLVIASFLSILVITSADDTITTGVLTLIGIGAGTALGAAMIDVGKQGEVAGIVAPRVSKGIVNDLLSDATGISFHRFQMVVWTIVLAGIFIYTVWKRLSMPDFSATLLTLQGISAGTYLGFKIPEKQAP